MSILLVVAISILFALAIVTMSGFSVRCFDMVFAPTVFVPLYWLTSIALALSTFNRLREPRAEVIAIISSAQVAIFIGGILGWFIAQRSDLGTGRRCGSILKGRNQVVLFCAVLLWYGWLSIRFRSMDSGFDTSIQVRTRMIDEGGVYGSTLIRNLSDLIISGGVWVGVMSGAILLFRGRGPKVLIISTITVVLYQYIEVGRMMTYLLGVCILMVGGAVLRKFSHRSISSFFKVAALILPAIIFVYAFAGDRAVKSGSTYSPLEATAHQFVDYHVVAYNLLSHAYIRDDSPANSEPGYGRAVFHGPIFITSSFLKKSFGGGTSKGFSENLANWVNEFRFCGYDEKGEPLMYNSYVSIYHSIWVDFGFYAIPVFALLVGTYMGRLQWIWSTTRNEAALLWLVVISMTLVFGLFVSPFDKLRFLSIIIWAKLVSKYSRRGSFNGI